MASSSMTLIVNVSGPVGLLMLVAVEGVGDSGTDQGKWNCPGGRSWKGFGKRSGVDTSWLNSFGISSRARV